VADVLVVEDEREIRELLRRYLDRDGFGVLSAATGAEALEVLIQAPPDLVLLDLGLPDIEGMDVLRTAAPHVPVIVLTARADLEDRLAGLAEGADDYVVKPFSPTEVVLRVHAVLARGSNPDQDTGVKAFCSGRLLHGYDSAGYERSIDSHVKNLRHKLRDSGRIVETVVGVGYRLGCDRV
jgi:DNA-binding response OmpR family regulator